MRLALADAARLDMPDPGPLTMVRPRGGRFSAYPGSCPMKPFWIPRWLTPSGTPTLHKPPRRVRPILEALEIRYVPSIVVNNPTDTAVAGETDLRQAIAQANTSGGAETITFDPMVFSTRQTINLTGGQLELSDTTGPETITGPSVGVTVNAGGSSRVFQVDNLVTASISGLTITGGNAGGGNGGGVLNEGSLALTNCAISGNAASSYYPGGFGGGVFSTYATLTLTNCSVSGNSATYCGGVCVNGPGSTAMLINCTVSGNSANGVGGLQARNSGTATLINCTVSGNSGTSSFGSYGGLYAASYSASTITLGNTIVAGNTPLDVGDGGFGTAFLSEGHNLIGGTNGISGWVSSDLTGTTTLLNPVLAPLDNYGGATPTMALLPGSPAIDAGSIALLPAGLTTDQRGLPRTVNGAVDIGAFESQGFTLTVTPGSTPQSATIGTPFASPLGVTVTTNNPIEPVNGGVVHFVAHAAANGASALLSASSAVISDGQAFVTAAPDNADGTYQVVASIPASASFNLTNTGPIFTSLVVNTTSDSPAPGIGLLSLSEAIGFANLDRSGHATITFDKKVFAQPQTITLTGSPLELSSTTETETITGPKAGVTVNGGGQSPVFQVDNLVTASISGLTITGGSASSGFGGVQNAGSLTLRNCTISGNSYGASLSNSGTLVMTDCTVSGNSSGLGVSSTGTLMMTDCTVSDNTHLSSLPFTFFLGGGVLISGGKATLADCIISGNSGDLGGGVANIYGAVTLTNCIISDNVASAGGGGVINLGNGTITLTNCMLTDNSARGTFIFAGGGAILNFGFFESGNTATLTNCTLSGNTSSGGGGGLYDDEGATATLTNCNISDNSANRNGGGLGNALGSTLTLTNCIVSGNSALDGGGLANFVSIFGNSVATLTACVVSGNSASSGGGIYNDGTLDANLCIIAGNKASSGGGGISTAGGSVTLSACIINANLVSSATALGGGIDCENSTLSLTGCTVNGNQASGATALGGGIYALDSTVNLKQCTVVGNSASGTVLGEGGGIYSAGSTLTQTFSIVLDNQATTAYDNIFNGP
jgi:fibronectin-binding autotransporter adhesin